MLPQTSEGWKNLALRQAEELSSKDERFTAMEAKHTEAYREAIVQRDEARNALSTSNDEEFIRLQDAIYAVLRDEVSESIDGGGCDSGDPVEFTVEEVRQGIAILKERITELEAALATARAQGREEGLREADDRLNTPETEDQERSFTERGFENFGKLTDVDGNAVTVQQSSARLDTVHLFCKAARPMDMEAYKNEATRKYMLSITSPILDASQARDLAAALTRFADTAEDVLGFCKFSLYPHRKVASCVDWRPND